MQKYSEQVLEHAFHVSNTKVIVVFVMFGFHMTSCIEWRSEFSLLHEVLPGICIIGVVLWDITTNIKLLLVLCYM